MWHFRFRSVLCIFACCVKPDLSTNALPQSEHLYGFTFECILFWCIFSPTSPEYSFPHVSHFTLSVFLQESSLWALRWTWYWYSVGNFSSHSLQVKYGVMKIELQLLLHLTWESKTLHEIKAVEQPLHLKLLVPSAIINKHAHHTVTVFLIPPVSTSLMYCSSYQTRSSLPGSIGFMVR